MTIHKNDRIRFLDSVGGGKVIQVDEEKHKYQLQYFRMQMTQNLRYRGRRLVFIHGKGSPICDSKRSA